MADAPVPEVTATAANSTFKVNASKLAPCASGGGSRGALFVPLVTMLLEPLNTGGGHCTPSVPVVTIPSVPLRFGGGGGRWPKSPWLPLVMVPSEPLRNGGGGGGSSAPSVPVVTAP